LRYREGIKNGRVKRSLPSVFYGDKGFLTKKIYYLFQTNSSSDEKKRGETKNSSIEWSGCLR